MNLQRLLTFAGLSILTACTSSLATYPTQEVAYPRQGVASPQMTNKPAEIDEELLDTQTTPEVKTSEQTKTPE